MAYLMKQACPTYKVPTMDALALPLHWRVTGLVFITTLVTLVTIRTLKVVRST